MSKGVLILGFGDLFETVAAQYPVRYPDRRVERLALDPEDAEEPSEALLASYNPADWNVFAAAGHDGLNFVRLGLYTSAKLAGFGLESFIHPGAITDPSASIGENCYVGEHAVVHPGARIDYNAVIGPRSIVGHCARVESSAWIGPGCMLGARCALGANAVLGPGAMISDGVNIGKQSVLQIARAYDEDVPEKTFIHRLFDRPVRIHA